MEWRAARLYLLFTPELCAGDPWHTLARALDGGVQLVQWRVKAADSAGLARCIRACSEREVGVIVNDHVQMAVDQGACGAHVGQQDLAPDEARRILGRGRCLGVSTHNMADVQAALDADAGTDYLGFGPCFPTATKGYRQGQPPGALAQAVACSPVPVFAIGGITLHNVGQVLAQGCRRVAVSRAILGATDPRAAAELLRQRVDHSDDSDHSEQ